MNRPIFSYAAEDFSLLSIVFDNRHCENILTICSGGETPLNLLTLGAKNVLAVDNNWRQIALARLKFVGMVNLTGEEFHSLLGIDNTISPIMALKKIDKFLPEKEREYWYKHKYINAGALWCGSLYKYLRIAGILLKFALGDKEFNSMLHLESGEESSIFVEKIFDNWKVKLLCHIFFNKYLLNRYYPEYGWNSNNQNESHESFIKKKFKKILKKGELIDNPVFIPMLTGKFPKKIFPPYFKYKQNNNIGSLNFFEGDIQNIVKTNNSKFTGLALCNVVDWLSFNEMEDLLLDLYKLSEKGARLLLYSRYYYIDEILGKLNTPWVIDIDITKEMTNKDKTGYHQSVFVFDSK